VELKPGFRDFHRVTSKTGFRFAFATSAAIDSGTISGRVYFRREPTPNGVVRAFVLPADSGFNPEAARPDREAVTDEEGDYELRYLSNTGVSYVVWAFEDKNGNLTYAPDAEAGMLFADTLVLSPSKARATGVDIFIVDPDEPATVNGVVVDATGLDTFEVSVSLHADSLGGGPAYFEPCDSTGAFVFDGIRAGVYLLRAFADITADSLCGDYPCFDDSSRACPEPCALYPDTLFVEPGAVVVVDTLILRAAEAGSGE
jgi:hypothetical protein